MVAVLEVEKIASGIDALELELRDAAARDGGGATLLLAVFGRLSLPPKEQRSRMQALLRSYAPGLDRVALLLVGRPFWVAAARSGIAVLFSELKKQSEMEVFDRTDAALDWLYAGDPETRGWVAQRLGT